MKREFNRKKLIAVMKKNNDTLQVAAARTGLSASAIHNYVRGKRIPSIKAILVFMKAYKRSMSYFFS